MAIDPANSPALQHADKLLEKYKAEAPWLQEFKQKIDTSREEYDRENTSNDQLYPPLDHLKNRYDHWDNVISDLHQKKDLAYALASELDREIVPLQRCTLTQDVFAQLTYLHNEEGPLLQKYHTQLRSRVSILEEHLKSIHDVVRKSIDEISMIENHPHRRLIQTIGRSVTGQTKSGILSWLEDKVSRNITNISSVVFGNTSIPPRRPSLPPSNAEDQFWDSPHPQE